MYARGRGTEFRMVTVPPTRTDVPARLDRLPWSRWHRLILLALGTLWAFNGLEVAVVASLGATLAGEEVFGLSPVQLGGTAAVFVFGAALGAIWFGLLGDHRGRLPAFLTALALFLLGTTATAFAQGFWSLLLFRFVAGFGIGGQYSTINALIVELMPAPTRGWATVAVNGGFWAGAIVGAVASALLLTVAPLPQGIAWRLAFAVGLPLLYGIVLVRRHVPESPRWMMTRGKVPQANLLVGNIERQVRSFTSIRELSRPSGSIAVREVTTVGLPFVAVTLAREHPGRAFLGFSLLLAQAFLYNAVFFTFALLLATFYGIPAGSAGFYLVGIALGSLLGPWTLGRLLDTRGRKAVIAGSYLLSSVLLAAAGYLFAQGILGPVTLAVAWGVIFFFASTGAGAAYLTVAELFPLEMRASSLGLLLALAMVTGGVAGPLLFAALIQTGSPESLFNFGYLVAAALMAAAGGIALLLGVDAERRPLESIARPLSAVETRERAPQRKKGRRKAA